MSDSLVVVKDDGAVRIILLNRPEKLNALNTRLTVSLYEALQSAEEDPGVAAVVLGGQGRAFCAGADTAEFAELTPANQDAITARANLTMRTQALLQQMSRPVVSAVQGAAAGGGAGLAIACDMMIAGSDLKFGYPEVTKGIAPAIVMTGIERNLQRKLAFELITTGRFLDANEAQREGLANRVVSPETVLEEAVKVAHAWASLNRQALAATKDLFYRVVDLPFEAAMRAGRDLNLIMRGFR